MDSSVPECTGIKLEYDKCFNEWFSDGFLKGDNRIPSDCEALYKKYKECIKPKLSEELKDHKI